MPFQKKTECIVGHRFYPKNTYVRPDGTGKECRRCRAKRSAIARQRYKESYKTRYAKKYLVARSVNISGKERRGKLV